MMAPGTTWDDEPQLTRSLKGWGGKESSGQSRVIGILNGEGIGPEIIQASMPVLDAIEANTEHRFELRYGGKIGLEAQKETGQVLTEEVLRFCSSVFDAHGAIFCGPGGGRFVYELRTAYDLYCKMVPLKPIKALSNTGALRPEAVAQADILIIRENISGLYQGDFGFEEESGTRRAFHHLHYDDVQVSRIMQVAINVADMRRKKLCVVTKPGGAPAISELWKDIAGQLARASDVEIRTLEIDTACYQLLAQAQDFDVVVAPNMFGDVLADGAALLLGARGMSYSANFSDNGIAVYQTGHGAAYDLAGKNQANPAGQIQSLAMMLDESFGLGHLSGEIRGAINDTLTAGWRTQDIMAPGCKVTGTGELGQRIAEALDFRLAHEQTHSSRNVTPLAGLAHE